MRPLKAAAGQYEAANFLLFLSGRSVAVTMSAVYTFAVGLYVLRLTGSGLSFALTLSLQVLPVIVLGPFAGALADRLDKKTMVVASDAFGAALLFALFFASAHGLTLREIYVATLLLAASQTLYSVCVDAAVPNIVSPRRVLALNAAGKIVDSGAAMIGPALGGILYAAVDIRLFVLLNACAFLFSTLSECLIRFRLYAGPRPAAPGLRPLRDIAEGLSAIRKTTWMRAALLNFVLFNFFFAAGYSVPFPYLLNRFYALPAAAYGAVQCFLPAGMILGALLVGKVCARVPYEKLTAGAAAAGALCLLAAGSFPALAPHAGRGFVLLFYSCLLFAAGGVFSLIDISFVNRFQTCVAEELRGRTLSLSISAVKVFAPAGYLLAGGLMGRLPAFCLPLGCGALLLLSAAAVNRRVLLPSFCARGQRPPTR